MDTVSLTIALAPLALYSLLLGGLNLTRRPRVISGGVDSTLLAAALLGLIVVGPMNLFLPEKAATQFGPNVWSLLVAFYALCIILYVLIARPRLVILNVPSDKLRDLIADIATKLDGGAKVAGDAVQLPNLGVQMHLEAVPTMRSATLKATGDRQSLSGWRRLQQELRQSLSGVEVMPNPRGYTFLAIGLAMVCWPLSQLVQMPSNLIAHRLGEILRM